MEKSEQHVLKEFDNAGQSCPVCAQGIYLSSNPLAGMIQMVECNHCQSVMERFSYFWSKHNDNQRNS